eukprot:2298654-Pyramimonas_sp.AAC.1
MRCGWCARRGRRPWPLRLRSQPWAPTPSNCMNASTTAQNEAIPVTGRVPALSFQMPNRQIKLFELIERTPWAKMATDGAPRAHGAHRAPRARKAHGLEGFRRH